MSQAQDVRAPLCVRANQPDQRSVLAAYRDPALLAKKGRLFVLCARDTPLEWVALLYERYYSDPSFDIQPVLHRLLSALCGEHPEARALVPLAVVIEGLNAVGVGTPEGALWLDRFGGGRELLPAGREARNLPAPASAPGAEPWLAAQYRLSAGDVLLLTTSAGVRRLFRKGSTGLGAHGTLEHMLRYAAGKMGRETPVTLIGVPGFAPVADLGPVRRVPGSRTPARAPLTPRERSPIWAALVLAGIVVAGVLIVKRPTLSSASLSRLWDWVLTPAASHTPEPRATPPAVTRTVVVLATATPAPFTPTAKPRATEPAPTAGERTPTSTLTPVRYPSPELIFPQEREEITERSVTLRWAWSGSLAEDEWFDVRMWREGMPKGSIAWTKERSYQERYLRPGWYHWSVVVVRVSGRTVVSELCPEPTAVNFLVLEQAVQRSTPTVTLTETPVPTEPPTATATLSMPTRVTPIVPTQEAGH